MKDPPPQSHCQTPLTSFLLLVAFLGDKLTSPFRTRTDGLNAAIRQFGRKRRRETHAGLIRSTKLCFTWANEVERPAWPRASAFAEICTHGSFYSECLYAPVSAHACATCVPRAWVLGGGGIRQISHQHLLRPACTKPATQPLSHHDAVGARYCWLSRWSVSRLAFR